HGTQRGALEGFDERPAYAVFDDFAADIREAAVLHAGGAGGLAGATGEATVQVQLRFGRDGVSLQQFLDQVDTAARAVELIAEQLVSRTGRGAESAMHASAQDAVRFPSFRGVSDEFRQI